MDAPPATIREAQVLTFRAERAPAPEPVERIACTRHRVVRSTLHPDGQPRDVHLAGRLEGIAHIGGETSVGLELAVLHRALAEALARLRAAVEVGAAEIDARSVIALVAPPLPHDPAPPPALVEAGFGIHADGLAAAFGWRGVEVEGLLRATEEAAEEGEQGRVRLRGRVALECEREELFAKVHMPFAGALDGVRRTRWSGSLDVDGWLSWTDGSTRWESTSATRLEIEVRQESYPGPKSISLGSESRSTWTGPLESRISSG